MWSAGFHPAQMGAKPIRDTKFNWPIAQLVERLTVNQDVAGSTPARPAKLMRLSYSNWKERRLQTVGMWVRILRGAPNYGSVAQSGEHVTVTDEAAGSKPVWSAKELR